MKRPISAAVIALLAASAIHAQGPTMWAPTTAVPLAVHPRVPLELKEPKQAVTWSYAFLPSRSIRGSTISFFRPSAVAQEEQERFNLKWPLIGAVLGAAAGFWYAERNEVYDAHLPPHIYAIPVGALAGFVVGILTEHIIVTIGEGESE